MTQKQKPDLAAALAEIGGSTRRATAAPFRTGSPALSARVKKLRRRMAGTRPKRSINNQAGWIPRRSRPIFLDRSVIS